MGLDQFVLALPVGQENAWLNSEGLLELRKCYVVQEWICCHATYRDGPHDDWLLTKETIDQLAEWCQNPPAEIYPTAPEYWYDESESIDRALAKVLKAIPSMRKKLKAGGLIIYAENS